MIATEPVHRRPGYRVSWLLALGMLVTLGGCGTTAAPRPDIPAELPFTTNEDIFTIRWALQKDPTVTRAVGTLFTPNVTPLQITMGLFGLDSGGSIVSRGTTWVRPASFANAPIPFGVELTPTGKEARYELRVLDYRLPGFRMN